MRCEKDALVSIQLWSRDPVSLTVPIRGERGEGGGASGKRRRKRLKSQSGGIDVDLVRWWGREVELLFLFFAE